MGYLDGLCELHKSGIWECILRKLEGSFSGILYLYLRYNHIGFVSNGCVRGWRL